MHCVCLIDLNIVLILVTSVSVDVLTAFLVKALWLLEIMLRLVGRVGSSYGS